VNAAPPPRVPWRAGFPEVVAQQTANPSVKLKDRAGYQAAKWHGDFAAATAVVRAAVDAERVEQLRAVIGDAKPVLVAVHGEEGGRNALPTAYATLLGERLGLPVDTEIVQTNETGRTGSDAVHRMTTRAIFDGEVRPGRTYVLIDDVTTQGGTLADLRSFIERQGGHVIAATTLVGSRYRNTLALRPDTLAELRNGFGAAEPDFQRIFGHGYEGLTEKEARYVLSLKAVDAFRDRVIATAQARYGASGTGTAGGGEGGDGGADGDQDGGGVAPPSASQQTLSQPAPAVRAGPPPPSLCLGAHHYVVRIYFEDTDAAGVVYYANYLKLAERARTEALRELGVPHAELTSQFGLMFMVRRAKLDYLGPARLDDSLVVVTRSLAVGAAAIELRQSFHREGEADRMLVVAELQLACVRQSDMRPRRIPPRWRVALLALVQSAGPAAPQAG
jgi:tol-pal system-associated acyl-CoA thioesterase